jgi:hypothetical protein
MNLSQGLRSALGRSQLPPAPWWFLCALLTCLTSFTAVPQGSLQMVQLKRLACTARPLHARRCAACRVDPCQAILGGGAVVVVALCHHTRAHCAITSSQETSAGREAAGTIDCSSGQQEVTRGIGWHRRAGDVPLLRVVLS